MLGLEPAQLRVVCPWVGGGFGPKAAPYVEHLVAAAAALKLGRPVKWIATRSEDMVSLVHGRDFVMTAKLGVDARRQDRRPRRHRSWPSAGAYPAIGAILPMLTQMMSVGVYDIPKVRFKATDGVDEQHDHRRLPRRRPPGGHAADRAGDRRRRRQDRHGPGRDPPARTSSSPTRSRSPRPPAPTTTRASTRRRSTPCCRRPATPSCAPSRRARRASGDAKQLGIGVSTYVEVTAPVGLHVEFGAVEIHDDGTASVFAGTSVHGQGHHTAFAMLASEVLGIPMDKITLVNSDTDRVPRGAGTMGSRSLQTAGSAIHVASNEVLDRAQQDRRPPARGRRRRHRRRRRRPARRRRARRSRVSWAELAVASRDASQAARRPRARRRCATSSTSTAPTRPIPFGAHVSVVEVDTETGQVTMLRHVAVDDCGRILNPLLVAGQQHGGIAQGAAQALYEWMQYDEDGNPLTVEPCRLRHPVGGRAAAASRSSNTQTDSPRNPLGAKGIGESGTIGSTPAIQNAVVDAVSHLGVSHIDMPCTAERVWRAIQAASA